MTTTIDARDVAAQLGELLTRTQNEGERFLIERDGQPVAALVPLAALNQRNVQEGGEAAAAQATEQEKEEALRLALEKKGLLRPRQPGPVVPFSERAPIKIEGKPLSETIIEDRR